MSDNIRSNRGISCDVGLITKSNCNLDHKSNENDFHKLQTLCSSDIILLKSRIHNFDSISKGTMCEYHKRRYLTYFSNYIKKCCDPFNSHGNKSITSDLRIISDETYRKSCEFLEIQLKIGDKICKRCESSLKNQISSINAAASNCNTDLRSKRNLEKKSIDYSERHNEPDSQRSVNSGSDYCPSLPCSQEVNTVNAVLENLHLDSLKDQNVYKTKRPVDAEILIQNVCCNFATELSKVTNIEICIPESVSKNILQDLSAFRQLLKNLQFQFEKEKFFYKKLEYLALLPMDWNFTKISQFFNCTKHMYNKLTIFRQMDGMFLMINLKSLKSYI